jgi:hypothetical protein
VLQTVLVAELVQHRVPDVVALQHTQGKFFLL